MGALIFLVVFVGGWIGLAKYWVRHGHNKVLSVLGAGLLAFVVGGALGTAVDGGFKDAQARHTANVAAAPVAQPVPAEAVAPVAKSADKPKEQKAADEPSLGMPLDEYTKRFNVIAKQLASRYRIRPTRKMDDSLGAERFTATLSDTMTVAGVLTHDGRVSSANLIANQVDDDAAAVEQLAMVVATLTAAVKDATTRDVGPTLGDLFGETSAHVKLQQENFGAEHVYNGVSLGFVRTNGVNMYSAQPADK